MATRLICFWVFFLSLSRWHSDGGGRREGVTENGTELALEVVTASGTGTWTCTGTGTGPELELEVLPVCGDATRHW